ncbi:hypothetical protein Tco_0217236 [Tanacetum coccineum]
MLTSDQLVLVNHQYKVAKANKKVDLTRLSCSVASKITGEILQRHSLRYALTGSTLVPLIYMQQLWNTIQLADSKEKFKFTIDEDEVTFSLNGFRTVLHLPHATDNNHAEFVEAPKLRSMIKFLNILGHVVVIRLEGQIYTKDLPQPWQTLCKLLSRCLTSRITGNDQPPLAITHIFYAIINNVHVDYAALI